MFKTIILFLIFYLIYKIIKKIFLSKRLYTPPERYDNDNKTINGEKIIPCEYCQVYFPESEAEKANGKLFCSNECAQKYIKEKDK